MNRKEFDPKTRTGWKKNNNGVWTYFENGIAVDTGFAGAQQRGREGLTNIVNQYAQRQTRLHNEAINKYKPKDTKSEAASWFQRAIEDPSISDQVRTPLIQANLNMINAFELEDTDTMTWAQSMARQDGNQDLTENITKVEKENQKQEVEPELQPDQYRESTFEKGEETTSKIGKIGDKDWTKDQKYDRTDPTQRRDRRLQDKLVEGRPLDKFKLNVERGNTGTPVSELFHKDKRRR